MMSIVVNEHGALVGTPELESARYARKTLQRIGSRFKIHSQLVSGYESGDGVFVVVATGHSQIYCSPFAVATVDAAGIRFPFKSEIGIRMLAVGNSPFKDCGELGFGFFVSLAEVILKFRLDADVEYFRA